MTLHVLHPISIRTTIYTLNSAELTVINYDSLVDILEMLEVNFMIPLECSHKRNISDIRDP